MKLKGRSTVSSLFTSRNKKVLQHVGYLQQEGANAPRRKFIILLDAHLTDRGFCTDMNQLLPVGLCYDPHEAGALVKARLLSLLPR